MTTDVLDMLYPQILEKLAENSKNFSLSELKEFFISSPTAINPFVLFEFSSDSVRDLGNAMSKWHMDRMQKEHKQIREEERKRFVPGSRVIVCNLQSEKGSKLNGKEGILISLLKNGRWEVSMDDQESSMSFKEDNIMIQEA